MKTFYKIAIIIFNLCLLFSAIITPALMIASSEEYYRVQFEKNEIYSHENEKGETVYTKIRYINGDHELAALFTDGQLNEIISHIVGYLFTDEESFYLEMDGVIVNDKIVVGQSIFGEIAVLHMADVKELMQTALWGAIVGWIITGCLLIFFIIKRKEISEYLCKYTLVFFAILLSLVLIFLIWTLISAGGDITSWRFPYKLWWNMHYLLFPFQPDKVANSAFNDTLTQILTLDLFLDAVIIVVSVTVTVLTAWFFTIKLIRKKSEKENN